MTRDELKSYIELMELFNSCDVTAIEFEAKYLEMFKADQRSFPEDVYEVLNRLFSDVDMFVGDATLRDANDLNEVQLRDCVRTAYENLLAILSK